MSQVKRAIGIDIGGTKTAVAAVDATGHVHASTRFETSSKRGFSTCLTEMNEHIQRVLKEAKWNVEELSGIGIGCAGPVNPARGTIHNPFTLPGWDNADIVTPLKQAFRVPARLENDADAAIVGESEFGAGASANPLVLVTLGTGIGGAVLMNGTIYRGVNGDHPEFGHILVEHAGPECYCGTRGCWESIASGAAIGQAGGSFGFADSRAVFAAAPKDPNAAEIIQAAVDATAKATWTLLHTFLPQRIILGGGIGEQHFDLFARPMRQQISRTTQIPKGATAIFKAQLGNAAGVVGAASLVFQSSNVSENP